MNIIIDDSLFNQYYWNANTQLIDEQHKEMQLDTREACMDFNNMFDGCAFE